MSNKKGKECTPQKKDGHEVEKGGRGNGSKGGPPSQEESNKSRTYKVDYDMGKQMPHFVSRELKLKD